MRDDHNDEHEFTDDNDEEIAARAQWMKDFLEWPDLRDRPSYWQSETR